MTRMHYPVVLELDEATGHYTATVPGLPGIIVDARSEAEAIRLAAEAIVIYRNDEGVSLTAKVVPVDV